MANRKGREWIIVHPDGKREEITNMAKWCRKHGLYPGSLYKTTTGLRSTYKGYKLIPKET